MNLFKWFEDIADVLDKVLRNTLGDGVADFIWFERTIFKSFLMYFKILPGDTRLRFLKAVSFPRNIEYLLLSAGLILALESFFLHFLIEKNIQSSFWYHIGLLALEFYAVVWVFGLLQMSRIKSEITLK